MMRLIGKQTLDRPAGATVTQLDGGAFHPNRDLLAPVTRIVTDITRQQRRIKLDIAACDHVHPTVAPIRHGAIAGVNGRLKRRFAFLQTRDFGASFGQFVCETKFVHHIRYPGYLFFHLCNMGFAAARRRTLQGKFCKGRANPYGLHEDSSKNRKDRQK